MELLGKHHITHTWYTHLQQWHIIKPLWIRTCNSWKLFMLNIYICRYEIDTSLRENAKHTENWTRIIVSATKWGYFSFLFLLKWKLAMNPKSVVAHIEIHIHFKIYENHSWWKTPFLFKVQWIKNWESKSHDTPETNELRGHQQEEDHGLLRHQRLVRMGLLLTLTDLRWRLQYSLICTNLWLMDGKFCNQRMKISSLEPNYLVQMARIQGL